MGFLSADEFIARRSPTLIDNPEAKLDEAYELQNYMSAMNPEYHSEISLLSQSDTRPMSSEVRIIVAIIASQEESRIRQALDTYTKQDIDSRLFEIVVLENRRSDVEADNTRGEVEQFQRNNPKLSVIYAEKIWQPDEISSIGNARKYVFDIAIHRIQARGINTNNTIIVSNDADTLSNESNYLSIILDKFDNDSSVEALATPSGVPFSVIKKPNLYATLSLWDALDDVVAENEPRNLVGSSSACRASIYAAIGGFNPHSKMAEDLELGFMIADARHWNPDSVTFLPDTRQITDPRRILESTASRVPVNEMYYKFVSSPEVRNANNDELLTMIPDSLDWELFEEDADNFWGGGDTGMYKWRGARFEQDFKKAMDKIGAEFRIEGNRLYLTSLDRLISNYEAEFGQKPEIIHSDRRLLDENRLQRIKRFFSTVSDSAIECRKRLAEKLKPEISQLIKHGNTEAAEAKKAEYFRLSGNSYSP